MAFEHPKTLKQWAWFSASVFVAGVLIGTLAQFFPVIKSVGGGISLTRTS